MFFHCIYWRHVIRYLESPSRSNQRSIWNRYTHYLLQIKYRHKTLSFQNYLTGALKILAVGGYGTNYEPLNSVDVVPIDSSPDNGCNISVTMSYPAPNGGLTAQLVNGTLLACGNHEERLEMQMDCMQLRSYGERTF